MKKESVGKEGTYLTSSHLRFKINKEDNFDFTAYCGGYGFIRPVYSEKISDWVYAKRKLNDAVNKKDTDADSYDNMNIGEKLFINYASALWFTEGKEQRLPTDDEINLLSCLKRNNFDILDVLKNEKLSLNDSIVVLSQLQTADISHSIPGFVYMGQYRPDCDVYWAESNYKLNGQTGFSKIPSPYTVIAKNDLMPIKLTATIPTFEDFEWLVNNTKIKIDDEIKRQKYKQTEYDKLRNAEVAPYLNNPLLAPYIHTTYSEFKGAEIISKKNNNKIYMPKGEYWTSTQKDVLYFGSGYNEVGFLRINISDSYNGTPFARYVVYASPSERNKWEKLKFQWKKELERLLQRKKIIERQIVLAEKALPELMRPVTFNNSSDVEKYLYTHVFVSGKNRLNFIGVKHTQGGRLTDYYGNPDIYENLVIINDKTYLLSKCEVRTRWGVRQSEETPYVEYVEKTGAAVVIYNQNLKMQKIYIDTPNNTITYKGKTYVAEAKPIGITDASVTEEITLVSDSDNYPNEITFRKQGDEILEAMFGRNTPVRGKIDGHKLIFDYDNIRVVINSSTLKGVVIRGEYQYMMLYSIADMDLVEW